MFTKSRPIPSKAALKVLYQLAYVSSGTVVGVAALCAEERRRRTQIVQKIADNAKRIRQSPRYHQNAALGITTNGEEFYGCDALTHLKPDWRKVGSRRSGFGQYAGDDEPIRGPELPSVVEQEYAVQYGRNRRRSRRSRSGEVSNSNLRDIISSSPRSHGRSSIVQQHGAAQTLSPHSLHTDSIASQRVTPSSAAPSTRIVQWRKTKAAIRSPAFSIHSKDTFDMHCNSQSHGVIELTPLERITPFFKTVTFEWVTSRHSSVLQCKASENRSSSDMVDDVELFLRHGSRPTSSGRLLQRYFLIADRLMQVAAMHGSLTKIQSLCVWKLSRDAFTPFDAEFLCSPFTISQLALHADCAELFEFYSNILKLPQLQRVHSDTRLRLGLSVLVEALGWDLDAGPTEIAFRLLEPQSNALQVTDTTTVIMKTLSGLLATGAKQRAVNLLLALQAGFTSEEQFIGLIDQTFSAALKQGHLGYCGQLVRLEDTLPSSPNLLRHCASFIEACDKQQAHTMISDFFLGGARLSKVDWRILDHNCQAILAISCTKSVEAASSNRFGLFEKLYRSIPERLQPRVNAARTWLMLKAFWQSTHDFTRVEHEHRTMTSWLTRRKDVETLRKLDLTFLEIQISANRTEAALGTLARIHGTQAADNSTISLAAMLLAKKAAWGSLKQLLGIAEQSKLLQFDRETVSNFNKTIHLYATQHSAAEVWQFVTAAIEKLDFVPNHSTNQTLLQAFVSRKTIDLIPKWLRYLKIMGFHFQLDAKAAAKLLTHYYLDCRPSHTVVMWLCRNLTQSAPSFAASEFYDLVKEAIGYDLRKIVGRDTERKRLHTMWRLKTLDTDSDVVPSPGYEWNNELYWRHPAAGPLEIETLPYKADSTRSHQKDSERTASTALDTTAMSLLTAHGRALQSETHSVDEADNLLQALHSERLEDAQNDEARRTFIKDELPEDSSLPSAIAFSDLRPSYSTESPAANAVIGNDEERFDEVERPPFKIFEKGPERDMVLALSLTRYDDVLRHYEDSLDAVGLPFSPRVLELAVEASLRLHCGDRTHAEALMARARAAGMNVSCAVGPLLIEQMKTLDPADGSDVNSFRLNVIQYYRMNDESGWPVNHHVGVSAANLLIVGRRTEYGINILNAIYRSEWARRRPFDIVAMTVFLKGYGRLQSLAGIRWVVETVLTQDIRITKDLLDELSRLAKRAKETNRSSRMSRAQAFLRYWLYMCHERRAKQVFDAKVLGRKLVNALAVCMMERPEFDSLARPELEDALFGKRRLPLSNAPPPSSALPANSRLEMYRLKLRLARSIGIAKARDQRKFRCRQLENPTSRWNRQYRAFLRTNMIMPDRKLASFRYRTPGHLED